MEYLFTKAYGIIFLCLFRTLAHALKAVLAPHLDAGKRHDEEQARFEPPVAGIGVLN